MKKNLFILILIIILFQGVFGFGLVTHAQDNSSYYGVNQTPSVNLGNTSTGNSVQITYPGQSAQNTAVSGTGIGGGDSSINYTPPAGTVAPITAPGTVPTTGQQTSNTSVNAPSIGVVDGSQPASTPKGSGVQPCFTWGGGFDIGGCVAQGSYIILWITARLLWAAGWLFNITIGYSLNIGAFLNKIGIINMGWGIFRDVANICFIFVLLTIAINTILQNDSYNVKKMLVKVIIAALLLNFSLFFTKVVIDGSNILALQVCSKISGGVCDDPSTSSLKDAGIAQTFLQGLGMAGIYNAGSSNNGDASSNGSAIANSWSITAGNVVAVSLGGAVLILVTTFVFFAATILFIIRTITLIFVMILSPIAFAVRILPNGEGQFQKWLKTLLNQSFFAPAFMFLIFIVVSFVSGNYGNYKDSLGISHNVNLGTFLTGSGDAVGTLYVFVILIGLMVGSLFIAKELGANGGDFARKMAGKASFGVAGWAGRQTIGRGAKALQESAVVKSLASNKYTGFVGRGLEKGLKRTSESSMDIRNVGGFGKAAGLGEAGGKGGFAKSFKDSQKAWEDQQKRVVGQSTLDLKLKDTHDAAKEEVKRLDKEIADSGVGTKEQYEKREAAQAIVNDEELKNSIKRAEEEAKARGAAFATPDFISKMASKAGLTTAQMAMVRKIRKDGNKTKKDKLKDLAAEVAAEEAAEENKEKSEAEPKPEKKA